MKLDKSMRPVCPICSGATIRFFNEVQNVTFYFCKHCEFIFKDQRHIVSEKREKRRYREHNNSLENAGYVRMFEDFIQSCVAPYLLQMHTALDFGCGPTPVLAHLLRNYGLKVDCYDKLFSPVSLSEWRSYDLITATEVFEHLPDPLETLTFLKRYLNPNGFLALMTHFHPNNIDEFNTWWYHRDITHISFFTPGTLDIMAFLTGFEILFIDEVKYCLFRKIK